MATVAGVAGVAGVASVAVCTLVLSAGAAGTAGAAGGADHRFLPLSALPKNWVGPQPVTRTNLLNALAASLPRCEKDKPAAPPLPARMQQVYFHGPTHHVGTHIRKSATSLTESLAPFASAAVATQEFRLYSDTTALRCSRGEESQLFAALSGNRAFVTTTGSVMKLPRLLTGAAGLEVIDRYTANGPKQQAVVLAVVRKGKELLFVVRSGPSVPLMATKHLIEAAAGRLG